MATSDKFAIYNIAGNWSNPDINNTVSNHVSRGCVQLCYIIMLIMLIQIQPASSILF